MAGRWRWVAVVLGIWALWALTNLIWTGAELARTTLKTFIVENGTAQFVSDGSLAKALANPTANTLTILPTAVGFAPSTPTVRIRPTITYECSNSDITVRVPRRKVKITMEYVAAGWRVVGMEVVP